MQQGQEKTICPKCDQNTIEYILKQNNFKYACYLCSACFEKLEGQKQLYISLQDYKQLLDEQLKKQESFGVIRQYLERLEDIYKNIKKAQESVTLLKNKLSEQFSAYTKLQQLIEAAKIQIDISTISIKDITEIQNLLNNFSIIEEDKIKWIREIEMHENHFYNYQFFTNHHHSQLPIEEIKNKIEFIKNPDFKKRIEQRILKDKADHPICFNTLKVEKGITSIDNNYYGQHYQGNKQGLGLFIEQQNKVKFGYFINNKFTWGQIFISENDKFYHLCGFFDNDLIQGKGYWEMMTNNNKIQTYQGDFVNGLRNGYGEFEDYPMYYKGYWENNEFHGQGELYDGLEKQEGIFERGLKDKEFTITDQQGNQKYKTYKKGFLQLKKT